MDQLEILRLAVERSLSDFEGAAGLSHKVSSLAHYTSLGGLEGICRSGQLWFSNPQFMNDRQELTYGIDRGYDYILATQIIEEAFGQTDTRFHRQQLRNHVARFWAEHAANVFIFCLTDHSEAPTDGMLSMWRAYGENGRGAAVVFRTDFMKEKPDSPLIVAQVKYLSERDRDKHLYEMFQRWKAAASDLGAPGFDEDGIDALMQALFLSIVVYSVTIKHEGFSEEREWRLIHLPIVDANGLFSKFYSYSIGAKGIEPRLKFPIQPLPLANPETWTFEDIVEKIMLGPGMSNALHGSALRRMLDDCGRPAFKSKLYFSGIPLRT